MQYNTIVAAAVSLAALVAPTHAYWRMQCPGRLLQARMDPIISPGEISGHVHTISGGNAFSTEMTYADTQTSECSSCSIQQDLSNYWVPSLYYYNKQGEFEFVPQVLDGQGVQGGQVSYYLQRGGPNNDPLVAFPEGFRMLAGNPFKRSYTDDFAGQAISFVCMNYSGSSQYYNQLPDVACPDGVRAQVFFPSCWDGKNLYLENQSHVTYPESVAYNNGPCPASHPVHLVSLFYELIFQTDNFDFWTPPNMWQPFVFAMGDPTGYGFHGDFFNGWNVTVLQEAIDQCTNDTNGGNIFDCEPFDFFTDQEAQACILASPIDEVVTGTLASLPGCNPIQYANATSQSGCGDSKNVTFGNAATQAFYKNFTGWTYLGCGYDNGTSRTFSADSWWSSDVTIEGCMDYCGSKGYKYVGLEYSDQCFCSNTLAADRAPKPGVLGNCLSTCAGDSSEICGGAEMLSMYELTGKFQMIYDDNVNIVDQSCPVINGANFTTGGNTYEFRCGQDFSGSDFKMVGIQNSGNLSQCAIACAANPPCTFAALSGGACYMKSGVQRPLNNTGVNALFLLGGPSASSSVSSSVSSTASLISSSTTLSSIVTTASTTASTASTTAPEVAGATYTAAPSCPASNQTYFSPPSSNAVFLIECGIDHRAGDLKMVYVNSFAQCITTCSTTPGCVDVSLSGAACYMKQAVGAPVHSSGILGARLISGGASTSATSATSVASSSASSAAASTSPASGGAAFASASSTTLATITSSSTSSGATATVTSANCPANNGSLYIEPTTGYTFQLQCGIDHQGGDLSMTWVNNLAGCINACALTSGCVDVSLSGAACYMKSVVGKALQNSGIQGALLVNTTVTSSTQSNTGGTTATGSAMVAPPVAAMTSSSSSS